MTGEPMRDDHPALAPSTDLGEARRLIGKAAADPVLAATGRRMLAFIDAHTDALFRSCIDGHLTGSALVVDAPGDHVLFLFHTKLRRWLQPGGHADGDANLAAVGLREATEETGITGLSVDPMPIDLDIHEVAPPGEPRHLHLDVRFLVQAPADAAIQGNHESEALRWVAPQDVAALGVDPGTLRLVERGLQRRRRR